MKRITFKEYYESKKKLLEASKENPITSDIHICKIYYNLPLALDETIRIKPGNKIKVIYENEVPQIILDNNKYVLSWDSNKFKKWLIKNSRKIG